VEVNWLLEDVFAVVESYSYDGREKLTITIDLDLIPENANAKLMALFRGSKFTEVCTHGVGRDKRLLAERDYGTGRAVQITLRCRPKL